MKFLSFWSINDGVRTDALCRQMLEMKHHGIEGVVYHPRFYPGHPDYMTEEFIRVTGEVILYAKSIGMEFWIYDENGWPSGSADGQVLMRHPDSKRWGLACVAPDEVLPTDEVLCRHGDRTVVARGTSGVSPLCRETTDTFLELTHERYLRELPPEAFDYVTGFFCDEVDYFPGHLLQQGGVPWGTDFESVFVEKYGTSPRGELWKLFDTQCEHPEFKVRFWETAGDLIARNFYQPYQQWCEQHGKLFTGHLKGEESPYFQLMFSGSCFTQLKGLSLPAIDTLERYHGNHFFPQLLASVAAQQGRSGCLAEAMGGAGWGVAPGDVTRYMLWLAEAGVERVVLHLGQFLLKAHAIRDWPPSVPLHLTWHEAFASVLAQIREHAAPLLTAAWEDPKVLIITPTRGVMAAYQPHHAAAINMHDGSGIPDSKAARINAEFLETVEDCHAAGWKYHLTEERELKNARLHNGKLQLGAMTYEKVLIDGNCLFEADEQVLVDGLKAAGMLLEAPKKTQQAPKIDKQFNFTAKQSAWNVRFPERNQLLLEWKTTAEGRLTASIPLKNVTGPITLTFSDPVAEVVTNAASQTAEESCKRFVLEGFCDVLTLDVTPDQQEAEPFAWLCGDFAVSPVNGWKTFDKKHVCCDGEFLLDGSNQAKELYNGLITTRGLPFFGGLLTAEKSLTLPENCSGSFTFSGFEGVAAARVSIDGNEVGWWWPERLLSAELSAGEHTVTVAAAPSTFNVYGPHRYYKGDFRLTSPDSYIGRGGFMDDPDAPACTLADTMQFVRFVIDGDVVFER